jgi:hypothetical protein
MTDDTDDHAGAGDDSEMEGGPLSTAADPAGEDDSAASSGNIAGTLDLDQPLEPEAIDLENALFVALGALFVIGFLVAGIQGL